MESSWAISRISVECPPDKITVKAHMLAVKINLILAYLDIFSSDSTLGGNYTTVIS
jgi:hypothetical protein